MELLAGARAIGGTNGLFLLRVVCAVMADGKREARKPGDDCWLVEGCTMVVNGNADNGRSCWLRWWRRLGRKRRVDLHGDERFFTCKFGRTKKAKFAKQQNHAQGGQRGESACCWGLSENLTSKPSKSKCEKKRRRGRKKFFGG